MKKAENGQLNSMERTLGIIEERVGNLIDTVKVNREQNDKEHKEIMDGVDNLCGHVNHENELMHQEIKGNKEEMNKRITIIEDQHQNEKAEKKGQSKIYKYATAILAVTLTVLSVGTAIAHIFGWF